MRYAKQDKGLGVVETAGFEPATPCVQSRCSPTELRPRAHTVYRAPRTVVKMSRSLVLPMRNDL